MSLYLRRFLGYIKAPLIIMLLTTFITSTSLITITNNQIADTFADTIVTIYAVSLTSAAIITALFQYNIYMNDDKELFYMQGASLRKIQFFVPILAHFILFIIIDHIFFVGLDICNVTYSSLIEDVFPNIILLKYVACAAILLMFTISKKLLDFIVLLGLSVANSLFVWKIIDVDEIASIILIIALIVMAYVVHYIKRRHHLYELIETIKIVIIVTLAIIAFENVLISGELYSHSAFSFNFNGVIVNFIPLIILFIIAIIYNKRNGYFLMSLKTVISFVILPIILGASILVYKDNVYIKSDSEQSKKDNVLVMINYSSTNSINFIGESDGLDLMDSLAKKADFKVPSNKIAFVDYKLLEEQSKVIISDSYSSNYIIKEKELKAILNNQKIKTRQGFVFGKYNTESYYNITNEENKDISWDYASMGITTKKIRNEELYEMLSDLPYGDDFGNIDEYGVEKYIEYIIDDKVIGYQTIYMSKNVTKKQLKEILNRINNLVKREVSK